jgi:hypothetical protein
MSQDQAVFPATIDAGLCQCGCGHKTAISPRNWKRMGYVKGQPFRFVPGHNRRITREATVYRRQRVQGSKHGSVLEHILIAGRALGKPLPAGAQVHHLDENRRNNANINLVICQDQKYHHLLHTRARVLRAGGNPNTESVCRKCNTVKPFSAFNRGNQTLCRACKAVYFAWWQARKAAQ